MNNFQYLVLSFSIKWYRVLDKLSNKQHNTPSPISRPNIPVRDWNTKSLPPSPSLWFFKVLDRATMMTQWRNRVHRSVISNKINVEMPNGYMQPSSKMAPSTVLLYCHLWKKKWKRTLIYLHFFIVIWIKSNMHEANTQCRYRFTIS